MTQIFKNLYLGEFLRPNFEEKSDIITLHVLAVKKLSVESQMVW